MCTEGAVAIQRDDMTVVKMLAAVQGELKAPVVPEVAPERVSAIAHSFDTAAVGGEAVRMLGALGAVGLPPPDLQGYTEPKPV